MPHLDGPSLYEWNKPDTGSKIVPTSCNSCSRSSNLMTMEKMNTRSYMSTSGNGMKENTAEAIWYGLSKLPMDTLTNGGVLTILNDAYDIVADTAMDVAGQQYTTAAETLVGTVRTLIKDTTRFPFREAERGTAAVFEIAGAASRDVRNAVYKLADILTFGIV